MKNKIFYKLLMVIISIAMVLSSTSVYAVRSNGVYEQSISDITVTLNGQSISFDQPPIIIDDRTLVPLRAIFEAMGATVNWYQDTMTVVSRRGGITVSLQLGYNIMYVNDKEVMLDVPPKILNNRTLVPVRAISEAFGADVDWDNSSRTVIITMAPSGGSNVQPVPDEGQASLTVNNAVYSLGMTEEALLSAAGTPAERLSTVAGYTWNVYGTDTYDSFFMAGVYNNRVAALCSCGTSFIWEGYRAGDTGVYDDSGYAEVYTDKNDGNVLHAVMLTDSSLLPRTADNSSGALYGESRVIFHMTNAFRHYHGLPALKWSDAAAEAARLHSQDMADRDYFSHDSLDGREFNERMEAQGIRWYSVAENISAGRSSGADAYDGWVNSSGHRSNMLSNQTYLGVGSGYNANSTYGYYSTQDFYS